MVLTASIRLCLSTVFACLVLTACQSLGTDDAPDVVATTSSLPSLSASSNKAFRDEKNYAVQRLPVVTAMLGEVDRYMEQAQWALAERKLEHALRIASKDPRIFLRYGDWYRLQGATLRAAEMYQRTQALSGPDTAEYQDAARQLKRLRKQK